MQVTDKVSVIVPCYNSEKWIKKTLDSIISQTHKNLEIIVVDDGSTDNSNLILEQYAVYGVKVLTHPNKINRGFSASLNLAIEFSTAEYIAFLDSDDLWHPNKIEIQLKYLLENPQLTLVYVNGWAIDENDQILYNLFFDSHSEKNSPSELLLNCYIRTPGSVLIHKKALKEVGGFDENLSASDHDLWLRIAEKYQIGYLSNQLFYYRRHTGQLSTGRRQWTDGLLILDKAKRRYAYSQNILRQRNAVLQFRLAQHDLKQNNFLMAGLRFLYSFAYHPKRSLKVIWQAIFFKKMN